MTLTSRLRLGDRPLLQRRDVLACEARATYGASVEVPDREGYAGQPVPQLAELVDLAQAVDQMTARMVSLLVELQGRGGVEAVTGLPVEIWLLRNCGAVPADRRMLVTAADVLGRMPRTLGAFRAGRLSGGQVRSIVLDCRRLRSEQAAEVDAAISERLDVFANAEPEAILYRVTELVDEIRHRELETSEERAREGSFLALQPRLDGTGGQLFGEFDALGFATIAEALTPDPDGLEASVDDESRGRNRERIGRQRADRLVSLCEAWLAGSPSAGEGDSGPRRAKPEVLVTCDLETLLGLAHRPAHLLTTLTGGRLRVTGKTARRLMDEDGAAVRLIVLDDHGDAIGVGRRTRIPPGWLRDASLAMHSTCIHPGCRRPARTADLDHAHEWRHGGRTHLPNIAPTCRRHHTVKTNGAWTHAANRDGTRTWRHIATDTTVTIAADTVRLRRRPH